MTNPLRVLAAAVLIVAGVVVKNLTEDEAAPPRATGVAAVSCGDAARALAVGRRGADPSALRLIGAAQTVGRPRDGFGGHGYRVIAALPTGHEATLSVPKRERFHAGLAYTDAAAGQAEAKGLRGADRVVRFRACAGKGGRATAWRGGLVLDRPRCVVLTIQAESTAPVHRRVPAGRSCGAD